MASITLDRTRTLTFTLSTLRELEAKMGGLPIGTIIEHLQQAGITAIMMSLYVGLKHEDPTLNPNLVIKLLEKHIAQGGSLLEVSQLISLAIDESRVFKNQDVAVGAQPS